MKRITAAVVLLAVGLLYADPGKHPVSGRKIANVCGINGADWLLRPERVLEEQPDKALDLLKIRPGMEVADIGAGAGYFSLKLAERVGETGKVYATDIQPEMLALLDKRASEAGVTNIEKILGKPDDANLPANSVDLILMVDVYHEFSEPQAMLAGMRQALRADGRLVLLEYRKEDPSIPILEDHKMSVKQVKREIEPEGFKLVKVLHELPRQHILIFKKRRS